MDDETIAKEAAARRAAIEAIPIAPDITDYLLDRFDRFADQQALNFFEDGTSLTYGALSRQARALASSLHDRGVRPGTRVALMLPNGIEFPVTWIALIMLGAVVVPVNVRYTARELEYVCTDSEADYLVIDHALADVLNTWQDHAAFLPDDAVIVVGGEPDEWAALVARGDPNWTPASSHPSDELANIQYTSGTTGFPKGVMLTRRYWLLTAHLAYHMFDDHPHQILAAQPFFYMDPQWLMMTAFYSGGTLHTARQASGSRFLRWCQEYKIDRALMPEVVAKQPIREGESDNDLNTVWNFNWHGDIRVEAENRFGIKARECFGMTEIGLALYTPSDATHRTSMASCGIPLPFREAEIRDDAGRAVPPGTIGELWIKGDSVATAYWNKPDANEETFQDGWFRTGDLFLQDDAGWFTIVGRKKDMIRRSGENVAAREVEAVLREIPQVLEAAVLAVPDDHRGEEIKAYIILVDGASPDQLSPEDIIDHCKHSLAPFKVPRFISYADELPRTPGRKVAKHVILNATQDLRSGSFDAAIGTWLA